MLIEPFPAWRPAPDVAAQLASVPYDVVERGEAAVLAAANPLSFLRVTRSEIDLPPDRSPYAEEVYAKAQENFKALQQSGRLIRESKPAFYIYRQKRGSHVQTGIVAGCSVRDYLGGVIKKHEKTRLEKEDDRCRHILKLRAHTGLVFLAYRRHPDVDALVDEIAAGRPLYDFVASDGIVHTVWRAAGAEALARAFAGVPCVYIADGHHRAAAAARAAQTIASNGAAAAAGRLFPAVLFPDNQLKILPYNRCVLDLKGLSQAAFLQTLQKRFAVTGNACPTPTQAGRVAMFLGGIWYQLQLPSVADRDPVAGLDAGILQNELLQPVLGIGDPRADQRIEFVGGVHGTEELERRVSSGRAAVAFAMYPATMAQLMAVADAGQCMPPKSTWFEPKLRDGLLIHAF